MRDRKSFVPLISDCRRKQQRNLAVAITLLASNLVRDTNFLSSYVVFWQPAALDKSNVKSKAIPVTGLGGL
jgi:hypothetical protein